MASGFLDTGMLIGVYDFQGNFDAYLAYNYTQKPNSPTNYNDAIYTKHWGRITPFLIGIIIGYIFYKKYTI